MTRSALELCIAPHDLPAFLERWGEREPLFMKRREVGRFDGLITRSIFDDLVAHTNLRLPFFGLVKDGALVPDAACTTSRQVGAKVYGGLADLNALYDGFGGGATVVLAALEKVHPA